RVGVGLANTRARLAQLYGESQTFELANAAGGGCRVSISIPFRAGGANGKPGDADAKPNGTRAE
ncbi:MAG: sensor histidine kinase, partial [Acidobacteria bacterium]|nr:sensor histidine kinase [Acidobacteriota bacterium]